MISEYRVKNRGSFFEARDYIRRSGTATGISYAQVAAKAPVLPAPQCSVADLAALLLPQLKSLVQKAVKLSFRSAPANVSPVVSLETINFAAPKPQRTRPSRSSSTSAPQGIPAEPSSRQQETADEPLPTADIEASETSSVSSKISVGSDQV